MPASNMSQATDQPAADSGAESATESANQPTGSQGNSLTDLISGGMFAALALFLLLWLIPVGVAAPNKVKFAALHPAYYPRIVGFCMLGIGLLIVFSALLKRFRAASPEVMVRHPQWEEPQTEEALANSRSVGKRLFILTGVALLLFAYFWWLPTLGFVLMSSIALLTLMIIAGERKVQVLIPVAALLPIMLYLFFTKVANIPIPAGVLQPWLVG